jgi:hypothetical protein
VPPASCCGPGASPAVLVLLQAASVGCLLLQLLWMGPQVFEVCIVLCTCGYLCMHPVRDALAPGI